MDKLITGVSENREVRIYFADTTETVEELRRVHDASPMSTMILGRMATAALMMGMMSKIDEETVSIQIKGDGPMKHAIAVADTKGNVKVASKYTKIESIYTDSGALDVPKAVGKGTLFVIRDIGRGEPFIGQVEIEHGGIADDITHYFAQSEQSATAVELGVHLSSTEAKVRAAGGILIQLLPGASEETISYLEKQLAHKAGVSQQIQEVVDIRNSAKQIMGDLGLVEQEAYALRYHCGCKRSKMLDGLYRLGAKELRAMIEEDGGAQTLCHFCGKVQKFSVYELEELIKRIEG
ncbi:MAG: Hsp33 family molecular chaperone HslO [Bacillota bacterium]|nr:Hsp33 family molecular chaperone HslO [Bacillota bacterium]